MARPLKIMKHSRPATILEVGPFLLEIDVTDDALVIKVSLQIGRRLKHIDSSSPDLGTAKLLPLAAPGEGKKAHGETASRAVAGRQSARYFLGQAHSRSRQNGQAVAALSQKRKTRRQNCNLTGRPPAISCRVGRFPFFSGAQSSLACFRSRLLTGTRARIHQLLFHTRTQKQNSRCFRR